MKTARDKYWDIMKGIGIICVVLGHSFKSTGLIAYVYLFHLPLFFFASGYLYNEDRYGDDVPRLIGQRIAGIMPRYLLYAVILVLLHDPLIMAGAMAGEIYDHTHQLWSLLNYAVFNVTDSIAGAIWFIPAWLISLFAFGIIVSIVRRYFKSEGVKIAMTAGLSVIVCMVGTFLMMRDMKVYYRVEVAFAMVAIVLLGYLLHYALPQFRKYTKWYIGIVCAVLLFIIQRKGGVLMDLSANAIELPWFIITSVLGIVLCLVLSNYLEKVPAVRDVFAALGRESLDIMVLHFAVFKIIDIVYVKIHPELAESLGAFPVSFAGEIWLVYLILGLAIPALIGLGLDRVKKALFK